MDTTVPARGKALVDTQISVAVPAGTYGRVAPRSGLGMHSRSHGNNFDKADAAFFKASKFMIDTGAGVIDADYRGVVFVLLFNLSDKDFEGWSSFKDQCKQIVDCDCSERR